MTSAFADDKAVAQAFAETDFYAAQEKDWSDFPSEAAAEEHDRASTKQIKAIIGKLDRSEQLVELISMCKKKLEQIPSSPRFHPYFQYFVSVVEFAIQKLGNMKTLEARKALDEVHIILKGQEGIMEFWDEAKAHQNKLMNGK
jgi:hypothetical protein